MSKNVEQTEKKEPVMTPRKTAVTPAEKKAQIFRVGFVLVLLLVMIATPIVINRLSNNNEQATPDLVVGLIETSNDEMYRLLNDNSGVGVFLYVGMSTCPFCQQFEPILNETLEYLGKGLLHYEVDTATLLDDDSQMTMVEIMTAMVEQTNWAWEGGVPALIYMVDGEIINFVVGVQSKENIIEFFNMDHFADRTWNLPPEEVVWVTAYQLNYVSSEDMADILSDESGVGFFVYIGTPHCPFCQQFEPILAETLAYLEAELRYFQVHHPELIANHELTQEVFEMLNELAGPLGWGGGVPVMMYFLDGQVIDILSGVQTQEAVIEFFDRNGGLN